MHSNIEIHHLNFSSRNIVICKVIGQRSRSPGQIFRRGDMPCFALPLFNVNYGMGWMCMRQLSQDTLVGMFPNVPVVPIPKSGLVD
jgi:hypothetical protein